VSKCVFFLVGLVVCICLVYRIFDMHQVSAARAASQIMQQACTYELLRKKKAGFLRPRKCFVKWRLHGMRYNHTKLWSYCNT
jgi:hypothetical protein